MNSFASRFCSRSLIAKRIFVPALLILLALAPPLAQAAPYAYVANYGSDTVSVIGTATNTVTATVTVGNGSHAVAVSPDGSRVYVANLGSNTVSVIDTATNAVTATVNAGSLPYGVAVSPDGSRVYVTNYISSGTVTVINTATDATVGSPIAVGDGPVGVAVSPDGRWVYVANYDSGTVSVIDTATNAVTATVTVGSLPLGVAVSPDGSRVYVANYGSDTVSVINTATDATIGSPIAVGSSPVGVAVSPDGSRVYVTNSTSNTVSVIDTATNTVTATVTVGNYPLAVAVSPDGSRVYVANSSSGNASVIDTATDTVTTNVGVGNTPYSVSVGPGALIATNSSASGGAGSQISTTVPTLTNSTTCSTTDALVQSPAKGAVTFAASTGAFTYTPTSGTYSGPDAFTWRGVAPGCTAAVAPSTAVSNTATVSLTLDPLISGLANVTLGEGKSTSKAFTLTGSVPFTRTLASDNATVLPPAGVTISPAACGSAGNLACTLGLTAATAPGTASVTVMAKDKYGDAVKKTVLVTVTAPPTLSGLSNVSVTARQNGSEAFTLSGTGGLTVTATSSNTTLLPNSGITGQSSCTAAGSCTLTLKSAAGQLGTATVTVTVADTYGQSASGSFTFTVTDTAPTARNSSFSTPVNTVYSGQLQATNPDSGQTLTYSIVTQPSHGSISITNANTGAYTYTPNSGYVGSDSFTFKVNDGYLDSNTATVTLKVAAGALATRSGVGGGAFGPWGLTVLATLAVLITLLRRKAPLRGSYTGGSKGVAKASALALGVALMGSLLFSATPARAADAGRWYAGVQGNVIKPAGGRNSATAGFKGVTLLFGRHLGQHFALEIDRASYSDYPETLTATANWVNWGLRGLYFPWKSQGAFAPFLLAGVGHQYEYRGDNSELSNNSASLGLGFTSQPWSAPVAIRADLEAQHGFGGGYTDKIFSLGVVFDFAPSD